MQGISGHDHSSMVTIVQLLRCHAYFFCFSLIIIPSYQCQESLLLDIALPVWGPLNTTSLRKNMCEMGFVEVVVNKQQCLICLSFSVYIQHSVFQKSSHLPLGMWILSRGIIY